MNIGLTIAWWFIPAVITLGGIIWVLFFIPYEGGYLGVLPHLVGLAVVAVISAIAWAIAGFLK